MNPKPPVIKPLSEVIRKYLLLAVGVLCAGLGVGRASGIDSIDLDVLWFLLAAGVLLMLDKIREFAINKDGVSAKLQDLQEKVEEVEHLALQAAQPRPKEGGDPTDTTFEPKSTRNKAASTLILPPVTVDGDPQKGRFGGSAESGGRRLSANVQAMRNSNRYFHVYLEVASADDKNPLTGNVVFYLHDTFEDPERVVPVIEGKATLELLSYGAFTVGAVADDGKTLLELDLAANPRFPKIFRES